MWVRAWRCGCRVTWFCYQTANKTATPSWPDPYASVKLAITDLDNSLAPVWRQAIIWTNSCLLLIGPLVFFNEIWIKYNNIYSRILIWKYCLENGGFFSLPQYVNINHLLVWRSLETRRYYLFSCFSPVDTISYHSAPNIRTTYQINNQYCISILVAWCLFIYLKI